MSNSSEMHYFKEVISKAGVSLQYSESPNIFEKEQSLIIRDIQKELEKHMNYPNNTQEFVAGLKYLIKKPMWFKKALLPSKLQQILEGDIVTSIQQENVFRLLLSVDCLQSDIISILLEEVISHAVADEEDTIWLRLLLGPLRYLSYIKQPQELTKRLLEILEVATYPSQLEILNFIPDIIPDSEYDETAKELSKILNENVELTSAIIDCLNYLNLSPERKADMQDHILSILGNTSSLRTFPAIFCFLVTDCKPNNLSEILIKTRNALDSIMMSQSVSKDSESAQLLTFEEIRAVTVNSKHVSEGWIKLISSIRSANDHKSVDIIILLMLHSFGYNRKHAIEAIFKKKVKTGQLTSNLLKSTLEKYLVPQILQEYIKSILQIAACLLRMHTDLMCLEFARVCYVTTFVHRHADKQHRQLILSSLILLTGSCDGKGSIPALSIMLAIAEHNLQLLQPHTMQLMTLLDKLEETDLNEVKQMFDLLCALTCGPQADESMDMFQNDIHMIVRKQLSSSRKVIKYRGIIAAVATAKNIATVTEQEADSSELGDESYNSISDLPAGSGKKAATLLELANTSTSTCPIAQGLYYDQLAQMVVTSDNLDKYFMSWLFDIITNNFQDVFVIDTVPQSLKDISLSIQYNLNTTDEIESPIAVNIAEVTIKNADNSNNTMLVFAPLFRLLRLIHHRQHDGNLSTIDALLGCGIILPDIDPDVGIDSFDSEQSRLVVDCLFHCINWFREIISAFVAQKGKKLKYKVLQRLTQLVEMEELFVNCMKSIPDHRLPMSHFYNVNLDTSASSSMDRTKPIERAKRKRPASANNTTKITTQTTQSTSTTKPGRKASQKEIGEFKFREMDTDIILLLKYQLVIDNPAPENQLYLTLPQFKFILKDLVAKLYTLTKSNINTTTFTHLVTVKSDDLIRDCVRLMPHLNRHLTQVIEETKQLLQRSDGIHDTHEMFLQSATELKITLGLILETLALILGWHRFQSTKNLPLLREFLNALMEESSSQMNSAQKLILQFLKCAMALADYCLTLSSAVHLVNIVKALCNMTPDPVPKKKLVLLSGKLLSVKWFGLHGLPETGATANLHIETLVQAHLKGSSIETLGSIVAWFRTECSELKAKDDNLSTFPAINKLNFPILYRGICSTLVEALRDELQGLTNNQHLDVWHNAVIILRSLIDIVKIQDSRSNLIAVFKKSKELLKIFITQGLPIMEIMLRTESEKVTEIFRTLQQSTRFIHNLCCHSKVMKDSILTAYVPHMREVLESLVYKVKAMLIANNCSSAFWMGNLRNKNLQGEEILSQSTISSMDEQNGGGSGEDELPMDVDDDSDHDTIQSVQSNATSGLDDSSEIF